MGREERAEEILAEWLERRARGEDVWGRELLRSHPDLEEILRPRVEAACVLDQLFASQQAPARIPEHIGGYRILREVGRGAMGAVFEAEQESLHRRVALKILAPAIANDPEVVARFYREAQAAARLDHPNIVSVHEIGRDEFLLFYTMEFVEGRSLDDFLEERRKAQAAGWKPDAAHFRQVAGIFSGIAAAIHAAHEKKIIHRDIKPSNILLTADGTPKVTDFGLARVGDVKSTLTETGTILGTLQYMSPEQASARRDAIDARTDVYSLGATLYECLTLQSPFRGEDPVELLSHIISDVPPAPRKIDASIPKDLEVITLRAMAKNRRRRYQAAAELREDLQRSLRQEPILAKRPGIGERGCEWARLHPARFAVALAVAVALVAGTGAAAAGWYAARPPLTPPTAPNSLAADLADRYDIDAAGIPPDAVVVNWASFLVPPSGGGIAVVFDGPGDGPPLDLCAFGQDGRCLWTARRTWRDYDGMFGRLDAGVSCLQSVVTRLRGETVEEETLCLGVQLPGKTDLLLIDPLTGEVRGRWRFPGIIPQAIEDREILAPLPEPGGGSGESRRLMIAGRRGSDAAPCVSVIEATGYEVQQIVFPLVHVADDLTVNVIDLRADWSPDRPEVTIDTSEGLYVSLLVKNGKLDVGSAIAMLSDGVPAQYDRTHGAGAFDKVLEEAGGDDEYVRDLARRLKEGD